MKKKLLLSLIILGTSTFISAQSNKVFTAFGQTYFADFIASTPQEATFKFEDDYGNKGEIEGIVAQYKAISYATIIYRIRYNLTEMSDESAVSIYAAPSIGLSGGFGQSGSSTIRGIGYLSAPLGVAFETGAGSTYNSSAEMGFSFKLGVEILYTPVVQTNSAISSNNSANYFFYEGKFKGLAPTILPTAAIGIRYWNKNNVMREVQIQAGYGGKGDAKDYIFEDEFMSAMHLQISFFRILNY